MLYTAGGCGEVVNPRLKTAIFREIKYFAENNKKLIWLEDAAM